MRLILSLLALCTATPALAGGLECQVRGTCQCEAQGRCDKDGRPIATIECGDMQVILDRPLTELPDGGDIPARFVNVGMPLHDSVHVFLNPVFHTHGIAFETAYCGYQFQVDVEPRPYVLHAQRECEGRKTELKCEVR